jgi:hypothetical protein
LVLPVETAEAFSATTIVTRSSIWLALRSRERSEKTPPGCQVEPGGCASARLRALASAT